MNYLRRFSLRCRGSHGSSSLPALRPVSLRFLSFARFFTNTDILKWTLGKALGSEINRHGQVRSAPQPIPIVSSQLPFGLSAKGPPPLFRLHPINDRDALPVGKPASGLGFPAQTRLALR
jgi:hypothetical protein